MKLTQDESRLIRKAIEDAYGVSVLTDRQVRLADKLLSVDFPLIPPTPEIVRPAVAQPPTPSAPDLSGESNTKLTPHGAGYFVLARRRKPFNFYIVEWCELHSHAKLLCEQLDADDTLRGTEIRDAKGYNFYTGQAVLRKERVPREKMEPVTFSFDP